jgi:hypothetical protein
MPLVRFWPGQNPAELADRPTLYVRWYGRLASPVHLLLPQAVQVASFCSSVVAILSSALNNLTIVSSIHDYTKQYPISVFYKMATCFGSA